MDVILNPRTWQGAIRNVREMLPGVEKSVQPASSPTGGAEGRKGRQTSRLGEIALALGASTFFLGVLAILLWALVRHGQSNPGEAEARCRDRINAEKGFDGDPDFYGLGIRVGIYLQWITCLVTCAFLPSERESATMTYLIFSISIAVATLVKVFANRCTFVAEMYVILILFWGGFTVVPLSLMRAIAISKVYQPDPAEQMRPLSRKLRWGSHLLNFIMSPVTVWFWIRLASVGQQDFAPGPIGTSLFFFVKIEHGQITGFSIFMAVAATVNFLFFGFALLNPSLGVQRRWMDSLMWIPLLLLLIPILFLNILVELVIVGAVAIVISSCLWLTQKLSRSSLATEHKLQKQATDDLGPISDSEDLGEHAMPSASLASYLRSVRIIQYLPYILQS